MDIILRHDGAEFSFEFHAAPPSALDSADARRLRSVLLRLAEELDRAGRAATPPGAPSSYRPGERPARASRTPPTPTFRLLEGEGSGRSGAA